MDKNFENIDNLVRQKLGGGEQPARSGAWQNMRELLDKEMPQAPPPVGLFNWGKVISVATVVVVAGAIGIGGYKIASNIRNSNDEKTTAVSAVSTPAVVTSADANKNIAGEARNNPNTNGNTPTVANENKVSGNTTGAATANSTNSNNNTPKNAGNNLSNKTTPAVEVAGTDRTVRNADKTKTGQPQVAKQNNATKIAAANNERTANTKSAAANTTVANNVAEYSTQNVGIDKIPVSGSVVPANISVPNAVNNTVAEKKIPVFVTKSGNKIPGDKLQKLNMDRSKQNTVENEPNTVNAYRSKRVIQKMDIKERFVKLSSGESFYKLDTISVVTFTEELGIITETKNVPKK